MTCPLGRRSSNRSSVPQVVNDCLVHLDLAVAGREDAAYLFVVEQLLDALHTPVGRADNLQAERFVHGAPARMEVAGDNVRDVVDGSGHVGKHNVERIGTGHGCKAVGVFDAGAVQDVLIERLAGDHAAAEVWRQVLELLLAALHDNHGVVLVRHAVGKLGAVPATPNDHNIHVLTFFLSLDQLT